MGNDTLPTGLVALVASVLVVAMLLAGIVVAVVVSQGAPVTP